MAAAHCHAALLVLLLAAAAGQAQAKLGNNIVSQWVNQTQGVVRKAGIQSHIASKYYALVGLASLEALKAGGAPPPALAAYAGHAIVSGAFPWSQGMFDVLVNKQLAGVSAADREKAKAVAVPIAVRLLKERTGDESTSLASSFKPAAPGTKFAYQFTTVPMQMAALYPQLAQTKPFVLPQQEADAIAFNKDKAAGPVFKPPGNDYADTFKLGAKDSKERSKYDTDSVFFWAGPANTSAISGHWLDIAREVLPDLSLEDTALFFARAGAAAYDASIAGWKVKYSTLAWRPITAFNQGYPGFEAQPEWRPLLDTPPHPEYPSGHQVTVGAILEVILRTLGKDDVAFTISSEGTPWLTRSFKSLTAAANEVGDSRLYGGVHFRSASVDGLKLGRLAGGKVFDRITPVSGSATTTEAGKKAASGRRLRSMRA